MRQVACPPTLGRFLKSGEWHDFLDQPIPHHLVGLDPLTGQDQCHRDAVRELTDCPVHNATFADDPDFGHYQTKCTAR